MNEIKEKRGSHVGVMISFMIFIMFILFFINMIYPAFQARSKSLLIDRLRLNLFQNYSNTEIVYLSTYRLYNTSRVTANRPCITFNDIIGEEPGKIPSEFFCEEEGERYYRLKLIDENDNQKEITMYRQPPRGFHINLGQWDPSHLQTFGYNITVTVLSECRPPLEVLEGCTPSGTGDGNFSEDYEIVVNETGWDWLPISQIGMHLEMYETNYSEMKEILGVPYGMDFAFNFTFSNGTTVGTRWEVPPGVDIYIESYPETYMDEDHNIEVGIVTIGVW
ncbi:hypothetical protein K0A97_03430 [Patescibacteria group bacterium]|nr:hypothetical protein [Patescibacteria group bacterium]